ncbi:MAG: glutamate-1-semialdehyde 2,1-aminomutase [Planctomycetota bacterium]|jgi:glutamate-1-semialdehyde 2,1-aminomutase
MTSSQPPMSLTTDRSQAVFAAANELIPGGVNSPVRAYRAVGGTPPHMCRGAGAILTDLDGNEYIDMVLAYGPLILGHANEEVLSALRDAMALGTTFGAPTEGELNIARQIIDRCRAVDIVRLVNSGTEATMSALRLARAATERDTFIKFNGCYHGHGDSFLVKAGSGALTLGTPDSPGVPSALAEMTLVAEYNDLASVRALFEAHPHQISCIFVEPIAGNMGTILPAPGFLEGLRQLCDEHGALLVFDEVMTGFRVARGGYCDLTDVKPDLVTLGKVIGGGLPIGAFGGRRDLMQRISPAGDVYQAGTLSGNPLAVCAGSTTLDILDRPGTYEALEQAGDGLASGLLSIADRLSIPMHITRSGSMMCLYLAENAPQCLDDVTATDRELWVRFFGGMLERGVHLPPSPYEAWFLSTAHTDAIIDRLLSAADGALSATQS